MPLLRNSIIALGAIWYMMDVFSIKNLFGDPKKMKSPLLCTTTLFTLIAFLLVAGSVAARAQAASDQSAADPVKTSKAEVKAPEPLIRDLLGVTIGMTAPEIKKKLGKPASADATGMYFQKDGPDVQMQFGSDGKAEMIALMYSAGDKGAPELAQVLGPDYKPDPPQNGRIYEAFRYPAAGYSIRYSRAKVGDGNMTIITMERIK